MSLQNKIQSLQQTFNVSYTKPDYDRYREMVDSMAGSPAEEYLINQRNINRETIEHFGLGYDASKQAVAIPHFKDDELINIKYRLLKPKKNRFLNEPNSEPWMFNEAAIPLAKEKGGIAICEGELDCISLWQAGIKNVISAGSGANSYGEWIEELDSIKKVWIVYDNDDAGQSAAKELSERIGIEKCRNVIFPDKIKDANDYLKDHTGEDMRQLIASAPPFYKYEFSGLGEVIQNIIDDPMEYLEIKLLPSVKLERDQLIVLSGVTNAGKTTAILNMIKELAHRGIPSLVMPFERGNYSVGRRYIQIALGKTQEEMQFTSKEEWKKHIDTLSRQPVYLAVPQKEKIVETIRRAKRLFGVKFVVIDHLDYIVRGAQYNRENAIAETVQNMKRVAEELGVIVLIVTHVRKLDEAGATKHRKPNMDDLKGSSSLKQDPEVVAMLYPTENMEGLTVDILKNKGTMLARTFRINNETGVIGEQYDPDDF